MIFLKFSITLTNCSSTSSPQRAMQKRLLIKKLALSKTGPSQKSHQPKSNLRIKRALPNYFIAKPIPTKQILMIRIPLEVATRSTRQLEKRTNQFSEPRLMVSRNWKRLLRQRLLIFKLLPKDSVVRSVIRFPTRPLAVRPRSY